MGDDLEAADNSWKKIIIAKTNNEWQMEQSGQRVKVEHEEIVSGDYDPFQDVEPQSSGSVESAGDILTPKRRKSLNAKINETEEQRARRLAKMSAYAARRLANETPEEREARLARMSAYAARRLAQESPEQRAKRLARMSAYAARRIAQESPEQRAARLARMSAYAARRHKAKKIFSTDSNFLTLQNAIFTSALTPSQQNTDFNSVVTPSQDAEQDS